MPSIRVRISYAFHRHSAALALALGLASALFPGVAFFASAETSFPPAPLPPAEPWQPVEEIKTYAISGTTGIDLYRSIGDRRPEAGVHAIAHTAFKLTWTRDYRPQPDRACVLAVAKPKLVITYTLPQAPKNLPHAVAQSWARFIAGVKMHERVHGDHIVEMVRGIETFSRGLTAEKDPKCQKVREKLQARLKEFSDERVRKSRDFDEEELANGGAVHQLILALANGP